VKGNVRHLNIVLVHLLWLPETSETRYEGTDVSQGRMSFLKQFPDKKNCQDKKKIRLDEFEYPEHNFFDFRWGHTAWSVAIDHESTPMASWHPFIQKVYLNIEPRVWRSSPAGGGGTGKLFPSPNTLLD
jgi:hypothetical protein